MRHIVRRPPAFRNTNQPEPEAGRRSSIQVYVFPLEEVVFFPHTSLPLTISEPRFLQMLNDSIENAVPVAVAPIEPSHEPGLAELCDTEGTLVKEWVPDVSDSGVVVGYGQPELIQTESDGSQLVFLHGVGRAILGPVVQTSPYVICRAFPVLEQLKLLQANRLLLARLRGILMGWIEDNLPDPEQRSFFRKSVQDPARIVDTLSMILVQDHEMQQMLLELPDLNERVQTLSMILENDGSMLASSEIQLN